MLKHLYLGVYNVLTLIGLELSTVYVHSLIPRPSPSSVFGCFNTWHHYMWWYLRGLHHLQYLVASTHGITTCDDISEASTIFSIWLLQYMTPLHVMISPRPSPSSAFGCFNTWHHYMWWYLRGLHLKGQTFVLCKVTHYAGHVSANSLISRARMTGK